MYTVGQQILGGQLVVASVDANNLILTLVLPEDNGPQTNTPLTITYNAGVTEAYVENSLKAIVDA